MLTCSSAGDFSSLAFEFTLSLSPRAAHLARSRGVCAYLLLSLPSVCAYLLFCRGSGAGGSPHFIIRNSLFDIHYMSTCAQGILCLESRVLISVKIGKNSVKNQSKTLIPKHKNQIFQIFLSSFPKTSYERRATRNGYIFVSKVQIALIIEGVFFYPPAKAANYLRAYKAQPAQIRDSMFLLNI